LAFLEGLTEVLAVEELDPVLEKAITYTAGKYGISVKVYGKLTGTVMNAGELSADKVRESLEGFLGEVLASPAGGGVTEGDGGGCY
ncbi:MAG: hypothetical protein IKT15_00600, partial [Firmicutes bacterium]|nr:hypothetical protein [Bacillota bacterium]